MYWRWNSIPELADLPKAERKRLWTEAKRDPFRWSDLVLLVVILAIAVGMGLLMTWLSARLKSIWIGLPVNVLVLLGLGKLVDAILIRRYRPIVRRLRGGR
jgi:polyferredoxin